VLDYDKLTMKVEPTGPRLTIAVALHARILRSAGHFLNFDDRIRMRQDDDDV